MPVPVHQRIRPCGHPSKNQSRKLDSTGSCMPFASAIAMLIGVRRNGPLDEGFGVKLRRPVHGCIMHDYGHLHCHLITMTGSNGDKRHVRDDFG